MMKYSEFKEKVIETFKNYMPEEFKDAEVEVRTVNKVNEVLDALALNLSENKPYMTPTMYINDAYRHYQNTGNFSAVMVSMAEKYLEAMNQSPDEYGNIIFDTEHAKDRIIFQLINTEQNEEMLSEMPHREFLDLSIIYRYVTGRTEHQTMSAIITNKLSEHLGFNEEQLFRMASENTKRMFPPEIMKLSDCIKDMFDEISMHEDMESILPEIDGKEIDMYIITNEAKINGATTMLYEEVLREVAEKMESDLYIMPSSIHEVIAVRALGDPYKLVNMVVEINMSSLELRERLSNQVYVYDRDLRKTSLATDTPNKRLDGEVL